MLLFILLTVLIVFCSNSCFAISIAAQWDQMGFQPVKIVKILPSSNLVKIIKIFLLIVFLMLLLVQKYI